MSRTTEHVVDEPEGIDARSELELRAIVKRELDEFKSDEERLNKIEARLSAIGERLEHVPTKVDLYKITITLIVLILSIITAIFRIPWQKIFQIVNQQ